MSKKDLTSLRKLKKVWYCGKLWSVEKILTPNEINIYILVSRIEEEQVNEDGSNLINMVLIDVYNDEFYPDIPEVSKSVALMEKKIQDIHKIEEKLTNYWLDIFPERIS